MKKLNVLSLFSGIGAFEKALSNLNWNYELINYCEIDKHASKCYSKIHNINETLNLWDVTKIDTSTILNRNIHIITHGSPCQDISSAGKQRGADEGSGTRSSLIWESVRIIKDIKPRFVIWENVKNCFAKEHKHNVEKYINELNTIGYKSFIPKTKWLNSKNYNIPQSRDRVFIVSILDCYKNYIFPKKVELTEKLEDYIHFRDKDDITDVIFNRYKEKLNKDANYIDFIEYINNLPIKKGIGFKKLNMYTYYQMDSLCSCTNLSPTLTCRGVQNYCTKFWHNNKIYKPSPRMCFRLMGFTDEDFNKVKDIGSDKDLWNRAGNSIVVNVAEAILKELLYNFEY